MPVATLAAVRPRRRCIGEGTSPASSTLSFAAALATLISKATSRTPSTASTPPIHLGRPSLAVATELIGTRSECSPRAPLAVTWTLWAPEVISQSSAENRSVSPFTCLALSGGGDPLRPVSQRNGRTDTASTPGASDRTVISASPGTTTGALMMTRIGYGPAAPSKTTFCWPMCADAESADNTTSAMVENQAERR